MFVLEAKNIIKEYKGIDKINRTSALNGINLKIQKGEFTAIMGPSGSGKTTLLNVLSGIDKVTSGNVKISEKSLQDMSKNDLALFRRNHIGFVFQEFNLLDSLTLKENIIVPMILDKKDSKEMDKKVIEVMTMFDIVNIKDKYPYSVSGGQQQKTAICRAIINQPDIVFADEPTGNLDSKSSKAVMECFIKLNSINNSTILVVTHDPFAASYCKNVVFLKDGLVIKEIIKNSDNKNFFENILKNLSDIGGEMNDI